MVLVRPKCIQPESSDRPAPLRRYRREPTRTTNVRKTHTKKKGLMDPVQTQLSVDYKEGRQEDLLRNISEFAEWGGRPWALLCRHAFLKLGRLENKRVLEIGCRFGKMTSLFALLGANVTALETNASAIPRAEEEARSRGVSAKISFFHYDGDLSHCDALNGQQFDIVFSKSVLVLLGDALPGFLRGLDGLLAPGGRCILLENAHGGKIFTAMRWLRFRRWRHPSRIVYFTPYHIALISQVFKIEELRRRYFPPIYLIMCEKKST
jgi:SAM-dependent methyltransferase